MEKLVSAAAINRNAFAGINSQQTIPKDWKEKAHMAWNYYIEEPLIKNCINSWKNFATGDKLNISSSDEKCQKEAKKIAEDLNLFTFIKDMILQLLVKGDAVGFKNYDSDMNIVLQIVCVNPTFVNVKYENGQLIKIIQESENSFDSDFGTELPIGQVIHLTWDSPPFSARGNSMVLPAFRSIELLRDYRKAEQAVARRWATPFRLIKVGGSYGQKMIMPDQRMLENIRDMVNKMDLKSGLVTPFYVNVETHGASDQALNVTEKIQSVREDVIVALGLSRTLISGDGPNYSTSMVSMQKMMVMIKEIKQIGLSLANWVIGPIMSYRGYDPQSIEYSFNKLDPTKETDFKKLLIELYDRNLISRASLQSRMDLDPEIEKAKQISEKESYGIENYKYAKSVIDMAIAGLIDIKEARQFLNLGNN